MGSEAALTIASRLPEIARARQWLRDQARAAGFTEREIHDLELVLSEACTNVIKHAYHGQPDYPIALRLVIDETKLVLVIRDIGTKFDLSAYTPPDLDQPRERGYGVFIIRSLMDEVHYDTTGERGTTLTLVKYRTRPTA
jgi:serine/threonine-protein kinase RsbW